MDEDSPKGGICAAKVLGIFGLIIGVAFLFMAFDVLTGSRLSSAISGGKVEGKVIDDDGTAV
jgi:hypothetical protein